MNNGKGLHAWIDEMEDPVSERSTERGGIIEAIQNEHMEKEGGLKLKVSNMKRIFKG
jgi:hypothetical protein